MASHIESPTPISRICQPAPNWHCLVGLQLLHATSTVWYNRVSVVTLSRHPVRLYHTDVSTRSIHYVATKRSQEVSVRSWLVLGIRSTRSSCNVLAAKTVDGITNGHLLRLTPSRWECASGHCLDKETNCPCTSEVGVLTMARFRRL